MFLLDTNILSEMRRLDRIPSMLAAWARAIDPSDLFLSAITVMEIEIGTLLMQRRDRTQGAILRSWIDVQVLPAFADRILPIDAMVAKRCAALHVPDKRAERDALIAATALVHRLTVVTRNI